MPKKYYLTEKIDGSSITVFCVGNEYGVCSRNQLVTGNNQFILTAQKLKLEEKLKNYGSDIVIQGELFGPKISGNKLKRKDVTICWFNVFLSGTKQNLTESMRVIKELGLDFVPLLDSNYDITGMTLDDLINLSRRYSTIEHDAQMEGIVFRSIDNSKIGFKIINPEFLLKS
jgi:ATP-dependent RNA circularization protein (DNA/RNA ligase family)